MVELLLEAGAEPNAEDMLGGTPLEDLAGSRDNETDDNFIGLGFKTIKTYLVCAGIIVLLALSELDSILCYSTMHTIYYIILDSTYSS